MYAIIAGACFAVATIASYVLGLRVGRDETRDDRALEVQYRDALGRFAARP